MTVNDLCGNNSRLKYLAVDSRSVFDPEATVFAALRTDVGDGHRYIAELYKRGVRTFIVENLPQGDFAEAQFVLVPSVPAALREIAHKRLTDAYHGVIITGSEGKTTLKELLYLAMRNKASVARSPRSWNSSIGVPLAIWDMTHAIDGGTLLTEAGIDGPGQGTILASVLAPSHKIAAITPVTEEHDAAFASHEKKILEKINVIRNVGTVVYDCSNPMLGELLQREMPSAKLMPVERGDHSSIYHALADKVLAELGIDAASRAVLGSLPLTSKRRQIVEGSYGNTIFTDCFTADFRSLVDALDFMRRHATPLRPTVLMLGEMLDETMHSDAEIARTAAQFGISRVERITPALLGDIHSGKKFHDTQILLFGEHDALFNKVSGALESAGHETTLEIDLDAMAHNYNYYRSLLPPGTGIMAMVKADAYGMGAIETGKTMQALGAAQLAVAVIEEGIALREAGVTMPILVLNPVTNRYPALFAHRLEPAVFSTDELDTLIAEAEAYGVENYPVHLKLDTGMHRVGFLDTQLDEIPARMARTKAVKVASVFSHLATADCLDKDAYTRHQIKAFKRMTATLRKSLGYDFRRHILNTAGMMRFADCGDYEMARLGIGLYGISPYRGPESANLQPVAAFRSHIISLKHWPLDTPIGYGCKDHTCEDDAIIATVPVGYADGVFRRFGNGRACFVVNGVECPTVGNICMDLCMIDVTNAPGVKVGDTVEIFGPDMPVERLADIMSTIPYEILTSVSRRVKRVYVKE